jgi:hypothetical protein
MGGTEIGNALQAAYRAVGPSGSADIFLVTDGQVSSWEGVVQDAKRSGHRIFTVGVGSAVSEPFVRSLATSTGGECDLVSPREGMSDRVIRHFERMRSPRAKRAAIHWPDGSLDLAPTRLGSVFEGDTVIACSRFNQPAISGAVVLEIETETGELNHQELPITISPRSEAADRISTVARLAAAVRLKEKEIDENIGLETALRYRLVSPWTNWLVIAARPEDQKAYDLPEIRKVRQTLAAGWGGLGTVEPALERLAFSAPFNSLFSLSNRSQAPTPAHLRDFPAPYRRLLHLIEREPSRLDASRALDLLNEAGLASEFSDLFRQAADLGLNVGAIAVVLLTEILGGPLGAELSPKARGVVAQLRDLAQQVKDALREMGRRAFALEEAIGHALGCGVFRPGAAPDVESIARCRDLLDHLESCARRSVEEYKNASSN